MAKTTGVLILVFFLWGTITAINSTLPLYFLDYFQLTWQQAISMNTLFYLAPFLTCLPCGWLLSRIGYRRMLYGALLLTAAGAVLLACGLMIYQFRLSQGAVFVMASGVAALQVVTNPYLAALSGPERQVSQLSLASALNSLGTTLAPLAVAVLLANFPLNSTLHQEPLRWLWMALALVAVLIITLGKACRLPDVRVHVATPSFRALFQRKRMIFHILALFIYVGVEVSLATSTANWWVQTGGKRIDQAMSLMAIYWGGALFGRFAFSGLAHRISVRMATLCMTWSAMLLVLAAVILNNAHGGYLLLITGLANAILYPVIFSQLLKDAQDQAGLASALAIMAGIGGAVLPWLQGVLIDGVTLRYSFLLPVALYGLLALWAGFLCPSPRAQPLSEVESG
ncbi:MFS transporter [Enterobacter sp. Colony194]|uniref:MFS transporter n=1 Tax=Enterobacter sp. Colony194 TaxID=2866201 RepID=UPI001C6A3183|nr:MFS transporter [Enterobacter sp. Colony194]